MTNWDLDDELSKQLVAKGTLLIPELTNLVVQYLSPIAMQCKSIVNAIPFKSPYYWMFENSDRWLINEPVAVYFSMHVIKEHLFRDRGYETSSEGWIIVARVLKPYPLSLQAYIVLSTVYESQSNTVCYFETLKESIDSLGAKQQELFRTFQHEYCNCSRGQSGKVCYLLRRVTYDLRGKGVADHHCVL